MRRATMASSSAGHRPARRTTAAQGDLFDERQRNAIPVGSTAFVQAFLEDWRGKLDDLGRRVGAMAANATSTLPGTQVANLLVRH